MKGEGHDPLAPSVDPKVLKEQILASNGFEGIEPSGEIEKHLPPPGNSPLETLVIPPVHIKKFE